MSQGSSSENTIPETTKQPNVGSTEASSTSALASALPPRPSSTPSTLSGRKNRSDVWNFFSLDTKTEKHNQAALCNYCATPIMCIHGTSAMRTHLKRCKNHPDQEENKRQRSVSPFMQTTSSDGTPVSGQGPTSSYYKFDQELCREAFVKTIIDAELSFKFIENKMFRRFMRVAQPKFSLTSRRTLTRDIFALYEKEISRLKIFLTNHCRRVCLTTDTWTSGQNLSYMCLTAHFIDNNWKMHKKILNFCPITGHSGEIIGKSIELCLINWDLKRVLSVTLDNASANNTAIKYLRKRFMSWNSVILKGECIHMRCCAHVLNLIVRDGLKEIDHSVLRLRAAIRYVKASPSRFARFRTCVEQENISYKGLLCLDVETRWNSTYLMLEAALKFRKAFELLELQDNHFVEEMRDNGNDLPSEEDWENVQSVLPFLKAFYDATVRISASSQVTSNRYMKEVFGIGKRINQSIETGTPSIKRMAGKMKEKYAKYWGSPDGINILLLIAVVLDPRHKMEYVGWFIGYFFDSSQAAILRAKLLADLNTLYEQYHNNGGGSQSENVQPHLQDNEEDDDPYCVGLYLQSTGRKSSTKTEVDRYLREDCEPYIRNSELDILTWWKVNATRFPGLANVAREVLAIPVSSVASESAFSTGGRVLDDYRTRLTPEMVEALVCTQDWMRDDEPVLEEDFQELERFQNEMGSSGAAHFGGSSSGAISLD